MIPLQCACLSVHLYIANSNHKKGGTPYITPQGAQYPNSSFVHYKRVQRVLGAVATHTDTHGKRERESQHIDFLDAFLPEGITAADQTRLSTSGADVENTHFAFRFAETTINYALYIYSFFRHHTHTHTHLYYATQL